MYKKTLIILLVTIPFVFLSCGTAENPTGANGTDITQNIKFATIPGGTFQMGQQKIASPIHTVTLSSFKMSIYEITQGQYKAVTGSNPSVGYGVGDNYPANYISWYNAVKFCNKLSDSEGYDRCYDETTWVCDFSKKGYRLPTEAEWEYACRAGTTTNFYTGDNLSDDGNTSTDLDKAGWYSNNWGKANNKSHTAGEKAPNAFGLYDMHGNVWEWCNDFWGGNNSYSSSESVTNPKGPSSGTSMVLRGGSWFHNAKDCQSAYRWFDPPGSFSGENGFRVVRRP